MDRIISKTEKNKRRRKTIIRLTSIVGALIATFVMISLLTEDSISIKSVDTGIVDQGAIETTISASGKLSPLDEEIIVSPINSRILETYKKPGETVEEGEPLLKLELSSVENEYKQKLDERDMKKSQLVQVQVKLENTISELQMQQQIKQMQLRQLHTDYNSELYLDSIGASTTDKVRRAELNYEEAKLELQQLKLKIENEKKSADAELNMQRLELGIVEKALEQNAKLLKDARILSPKKATLTYINNLIGSQVTQGTQVAIVSDLSRFKVEAEVAEGHRERLALGAKAIIRIGETDLTGTVVNITPSITNGVINFTVIPDDAGHSSLRSGLKADVYVMHGRRQDVLRIPNGEWCKYGKGNYFLWVVNGDKAEKRSVQVGENSFEYVEVISGLSKGEKVILNNMEKYKDKKSIHIK
ncbi:efflux RND transporter periplasmic adaptor subunit [Dysgonomonas sp. 25]|uniref:efflux RND transporter periplasmic adaptor subunit n=1 Tax=Dysgonomonas sp. 25 TaxID=2302933 RepID=UPI0013D086F2|nr:HlyD family efflux transporter periplasmic adaptor subunit [Dysgonomonas sp. 25]NDV67875.1 HlyD family efflux transporter periplasmic adaptor subunit [Dysgonomonas sp. 25]